MGEFQSVKHIKLQEYLFLNLAYLLEESGAKIQFGNPQYGDAALGFAITMFRVGAKCYEYAIRCLQSLGEDPVRECGVTTSVTFYTPEENLEFRMRFKSLLDEAQKRLPSLNGKTPQEFYMLQLKPLITEIVSTDNKHCVALQADIHDAVDLLCLEETFEPWTDCERIRDYQEITIDDDGKADVHMVFYRIRTRKKFILYLKELGVKGDI